MDNQPLPDWTEQDISYLNEYYGITSIVEFARTLGKDLDEVQQMISQLGLKEAFIQSDQPDLRIKLSIFRLLQDHKRFLPNGWLVGLAMSNLMMRSLIEQINNAETWIEEVEEEINNVLDAVVQLHELTPLLMVGDMLKDGPNNQASVTLG